ncbi:MAG: cyclic nucleotide-binding domain-containing protein [Verrucomicrobiaceae bacterium]|nr:MAG: cyclic nucleotide-binding domain-containing protein [Verrucomicrobiaceae bacterium]
MSNTPEFLQKLRSTSLFREFTNDELQSCLDLMDPQQANAGDCIVRQDEPGDAMYLLVEGTARVLHQQDGHKVELAGLRPGDFFGEIALVDQGPRSADVEAITDCTLFRITQATISALAGVYPTAAFKFLIAVGRILVERMRLSNRRYIDSLLVR